MAVTVDQLLSPGCFNIFNIGAYLGFDDGTEERRNEANQRGRHFFEELGLLPQRDAVVLCEQYLYDANRNPVRDALGRHQQCGEVMIPNDDPTRSLGFRFVCRGIKGPCPGCRRDGICRRLPCQRLQAQRRRTHPKVAVDPCQNTIFHQTRIEYAKMLKLLYFWFKKKEVTEAAQQCGVAQTTAVQWYLWFRESVTLKAWHDFDKIGGPNYIVEVDETLIARRKNNQGRLIREQWVFGGIDRTTKQCFAMHVDARDNPTLGAELMDCVEAGTLVCSDGWAAYQQIPNLRVDNNGPVYFRGHEVVIHDRNFLNPPRGEEPEWRTGYDFQCRDKQYIGPYPPPHPVEGDYIPLRWHTQNAERIWREDKKIIKSTRNPAIISSYLGEAMYRQNILNRLPEDEGHRFRQLIRHFTEIYPGPNVTPIRANKPGFRMFARNNQDLCDCDRCSTD